MDLSILGWAFAAGFLVAFNPCGFAMLPAYVAYSLGQREERTHFFGKAVRGIANGALMATGVLGIFAVVGVVVSAVGTTLVRFVPWFSAVIGLVLVALGVRILTRRRGFSLTVPNPFSGRVGESSGGGAFLLFGASYAVASMGCTLPIFLVVVAQALRASSFVEGLGAFLSYALGLGTVLILLSVSVAVGKEAVVRTMRPLGGLLETLGGIGLVIAGGYLVYYQVHVVRLFTFLSR
jgi:cytochrome c biogenesis protein CcdA